MAKAFSVTSETNLASRRFATVPFTDHQSGRRRGKKRWNWVEHVEDGGRVTVRGQ